jgi:hypothetical protein
MLTVVAIIAACCVGYVFSPEVAFVLMYRGGRRFPSRLVRVLYSPLEALAKRSRAFSDWYTRFHWWMYRRFVNNSPPPPPPRVPPT